MNYNGSKETNKIKRRNFFYYLGVAAAGTFVFSKFPINLFRKKTETRPRSSIKVTASPLAVKRTPSVKGPLNG